MLGCFYRYMPVVRDCLLIGSKQELKHGANFQSIWDRLRSFTSCPQYVNRLRNLRENLIASSQLIDNLGFSPIEAQALSVAPYVVAYLLVFALARHSDYMRQRGWHVMAACMMSTIGYVILATTAGQSKGVAYFALFLVVGGVFSLFPLVM